jgi:hypothetical protein
VTEFDAALECFETSGDLKPDLPDPILRWNRCVRLLNGHPLLREAAQAPREQHARLGD